MVNIFAPTPRTYPSDFDSIAEELIELENPVMGTSVPAPACFASFSYQPSPVKNALSPTSIMDVHVPADSSSIPNFMSIIRIIPPITQIPPPTANATGIFTFELDFGETFLFISSYCCGVVLIKSPPSGIFCIFLFFMQKKYRSICFGKVRKIRKNNYV